ncbi:hypothetical protein BC830DRAFT_817831 [Chytriomyces sp. MP71]|nr:hypothetical protein BC830DRAFT_817831 [Chytriomyces sp. MP71]
MGEGDSSSEHTRMSTASGGPRTASTLNFQQQVGRPSTVGLSRTRSMPAAATDDFFGRSFSSWSQLSPADTDQNGAPSTSCAFASKSTNRSTNLTSVFGARGMFSQQEGYTSPSEQSLKTPSVLQAPANQPVSSTERFVRAPISDLVPDSESLEYVFPPTPGFRVRFCSTTSWFLPIPTEEYSEPGPLTITFTQRVLRAEHLQHIPSEYCAAAQVFADSAHWWILVHDSTGLVLEYPYTPGTVDVGDIVRVPGDPLTLTVGGEEVHFTGPCRLVAGLATYEGCDTCTHMGAPYESSRVFRLRVTGGLGRGFATSFWRDVRVADCVGYWGVGEMEEALFGCEEDSSLCENAAEQARNMFLIVLEKAKQLDAERALKPQNTLVVAPGSGNSDVEMGEVGEAAAGATTNNGSDAMLVELIRAGNAASTIASSSLAEMAETQDFVMREPSTEPIQPLSPQVEPSSMSGTDISHAGLLNTPDGQTQPVAFEAEMVQDSIGTNVASEVPCKETRVLESSVASRKDEPEIAVNSTANLTDAVSSTTHANVVPLAVPVMPLDTRMEDTLIDRVAIVTTSKDGLDSDAPKSKDGADCDVPKGKDGPDSDAPTCKDGPDYDAHAPKSIDGPDFDSQKSNQELRHVELCAGHDGEVDMDELTAMEDGQDAIPGTPLPSGTDMEANEIGTPLVRHTSDSSSTSSGAFFGSQETVVGNALDTAEVVAHVEDNDGKKRAGGSGPFAFSQNERDKDEGHVTRASATGRDLFPYEDEDVIIGGLHERDDGITGNTTPRSRSAACHASISPAVIPSDGLTNGPDDTVDNKENYDGPLAAVVALPSTEAFTELDNNAAEVPLPEEDPYEFASPPPQLSSSLTQEVRDNSVALMNRVQVESVLLVPSMKLAGTPSKLPAVADTAVGEDAYSDLAIIAPAAESHALKSAVDNVHASSVIVSSSVKVSSTKDCVFRSPTSAPVASNSEVRRTMTNYPTASDDANPTHAGRNCERCVSQKKKCDRRLPKCTLCAGLKKNVDCIYINLAAGVMEVDSETAVTLVGGDTAQMDVEDLPETPTCSIKADVTGLTADVPLSASVATPSRTTRQSIRKSKHNEEASMSVLGTGKRQNPFEIEKATPSKGRTAPKKKPKRDVAEVDREASKENPAEESIAISDGE